MIKYSRKWVLTLLLLVAGILLPIKAYAKDAPTVKYQIYSLTNSWQDFSGYQNMSEAPEIGNPIAGLKIELEDLQGNSMIDYRIHSSEIFWGEWEESGGEAVIENGFADALQIQLSDKYSFKYDIYYRVHVKGVEWLSWAKNGEITGTEHIDLPIDSCQIVLCEKDTVKICSKTPKYIKAPELDYKVCVPSGKWKQTVNEGAMAGAKFGKIEAFRIYLKNDNGENGISYRTHISGKGWYKWKNSGEIAGSVGKDKFVDAIQIKLCGNLKKYYDVYYRVHIENEGWYGWTSNGEEAGTVGGSIPITAIEVKLCLKNQAFEDTIPAFKKLSVDIDSDEMFFNQNKRGTCTLVSAAMMLKRRAALDKKTYWPIISEESIRADAWLSGVGLYNSFTFRDYTVTKEKIAGSAQSKKLQLINLLEEHKEGIEIYDSNLPHAILLTDYNEKEDIFYCSDPAECCEEGRIPISLSYLADQRGKNQLDVIGNITYYWYVK